MERTRRGALAALGAGVTGLAVGAVSRDGGGSARAAGGAWPQSGADAGNTGSVAERGPRSGTERWRYEGGRGPRTPPLVADGYVFPQSEGATALDAATGDPAWRAGGTSTRTRRDAARATAYSRATAVADGRVLVHGGDTLYALPTDGRRVEWSHELPGPNAAVTVADGTAYVWTGNLTQSVVVGLRVADGAKRFRYRTEPGHGVPAVADGTLFLDLESRLAALEAETGAERWSYSPPPADEGTDSESSDGAGIARSPVVADGTVYAATGDSRLLAVDAADGHEQWRFTPDERPPAGPGQPPVGSRPAVADGTVYAGFSDGRVRAFDAASGAERWSFRAWNGVTGAPAVTGGTVYVGGWDTMVYALDRATGRRRWEFSTDSVVRGVSVAGGRAYATTDRRLYALGDGGDA